jgi:hypothetical protein
VPSFLEVSDRRDGTGCPSGAAAVLVLATTAAGARLVAADGAGDPPR